MPEKGYFRRMGLYFVSGLIALVVAVLVTIGLAWFFAPVGALMVSAFAGVAMAVAVFVLLFLLVFGLVYLVIMVGVFIEYVRKPMRVERGDYSIASVSESGRRSRGASGTRKSRKTTKRKQKR
jgi:uncharacterized membrane protein